MKAENRLTYSQTRVLDVWKMCDPYLWDLDAGLGVGLAPRVPTKVPAALHHDDARSVGRCPLGDGQAVEPGPHDDEVRSAQADVNGVSFRSGLRSSTGALLHLD